MNQWAGYVSGSTETRNDCLTRQRDQLQALAESYRRRLTWVEERIVEIDNELGRP